jgi:hypothetical protein
MFRSLARSVTPRATGVLFLLAAIAAVFASQTALASGPTIPARHTAGYVPAHGVSRDGASSPNDLTYHGGPVMRVIKNYAIYWIPSGYSVSANYKTLIDRYFTDVAAASGANTNVYSVETQYYDNTGPIAYSSTFGGSVTDTNPFPANAYGSCGGPSKCLSDGQLQTEINNQITAHSWVKSLTTEFFIFTPKNVGSCDGPGSCSYSVFCAYHGYGAANLIYANQPYAAVSGCNTDHPNGDDADATINVASHENREAINDEHLNAWYNDNTGEEGSDQCAWNFGTPLGGGSGTHYNQIINGNHYWLQQEWSNDGSTCLLQYGAGGNPPPTVTSFSPMSGPVGTNVDIMGTGFTGATGVTFGGVSASVFNVDSAIEVHATVPNSAVTGPIAVSTSNGTGTSASNFTVTGGGGNPPTVTSFSPTSGPVGTSVTINGTNFTGVTSVKFNTTTATTYTVNSSVKITATVPAGASTGPISVSNGDGTGTSVGSFTVTVASGAPTITSFSPTFGRTGAKVTINGTNFTGATSVKLGTVSAGFTLNSANRITATVPFMSSGHYKWSVTTASGTGTSTATFFHL